ncbi:MULTISPECIES: adenine phosphoribosyltransferase [Amphritea]|jgi:adenine phosphoribosyltransferase|uniref:Adenine phosphoribosyltransferase n=2 Tax=Amphritea TaxID=515417 RepID=A0A1H9FL33_9GAMM|nr:MULTISPECIES: adenine phosphoribosyltransferase [Amphritea]MBN0986145.1 adenine phosphoribosyltransferase [Amphritea pacifica]MBN1007551.1 adenine phosphoribosyltransferase [Amphritea pacifica]SEQ38667.1 adenine phosphoribosyltransferase [Amphritea atlantica]
MSFDECYIKSVMRTIPDWPEPGVMFRDITPLFKDPKALRMIADSFIQRYIDTEVTHIASIDARGFLFGSIMAYQLNIPLVLVRKKGKLPGKTIHREYALEYGTAAVEMQVDAVSKGDKVLIFDDLIATGGTILAASTIIKELGAEVYEAAALIDLPDLKGSELIQQAGIPVYTLLAYEGL